MEVFFFIVIIEAHQKLDYYLMRFLESNHLLMKLYGVIGRVVVLTIHMVKSMILFSGFQNLKNIFFDQIFKIIQEAHSNAQKLNFRKFELCKYEGFGPRDRHGSIRLEILCRLH